MTSCCYTALIIALSISYRNDLRLDMFCCAFSVSHARAECRVESNSQSLIWKCNMNFLNKGITYVLRRKVLSKAPQRLWNWNSYKNIYCLVWNLGFGCQKKIENLHHCLWHRMRASFCKVWRVIVLQKKEIGVLVLTRTDFLYLVNWRQ